MIPYQLLLTFMPYRNAVIPQCMWLSFKVHNPVNFSHIKQRNAISYVQLYFFTCPSSISDILHTKWHYGWISQCMHWRNIRYFCTMYELHISHEKWHSPMYARTVLFNNRPHTSDGMWMVVWWYVKLFGNYHFLS